MYYKKVSGRCWTNEDGSIHERGIHNHDVDVIKIECLLLKQEILTMADETTYNTREIFDKCIIEKNSHLSQHFNRKNIYTLIYKLRLKKLRINEKETSEIPIKLRRTYENKDFVYFEDEKQRMKIFCTQKNLKCLNMSKQWIIDGTFLAAPEGYSQLYVLIGFVFQKALPLVYCLMKTRTEFDYDLLFQMIKNEVDLIQEREIIMDNEKAMKNSILKNFAHVKIYNCLYHYSKNINEKLNAYNLLNEYKTNKEFKKTVDMMKSLVFVNKKNFTESFKLVKSEFEKLKNTRSLFILRYFESSFVDKTTDLIKSDFYSFDRVLNSTYLTTNFAEGNNSSLNALLGHKKPSLIHLVKTLLNLNGKTEESRKKVLIEPNSEFRSKKTIEKMGKMQMIAEKYDLYALDDYLVVFSDIYNWCSKIY
jgi:hypothetical protein